MLLTILPAGVYSNGWLAAKLSLELPLTQQTLNRYKARIDLGFGALEQVVSAEEAARSAEAAGESLPQPVVVGYPVQRGRRDDRDDVALDPAFTGFGRASTDFATGRYWFETVKPGCVPAPQSSTPAIGVSAPGCSTAAQVRCDMSPVIFNTPYAPQPLAWTTRSGIRSRFW